MRLVPLVGHEIEHFLDGPADQDLALKLRHGAPPLLFSITPVRGRAPGCCAAGWCWMSWAMADRRITASTNGVATVTGGVSLSIILADMARAPDARTGRSASGG